MSKNVVLSPLGMVNLASQQVVMSRLVWDDVDVAWFVEEMEAWAKEIKERRLMNLYDSLDGNHRVNEQA